MWAVPLLWCLFGRRNGGVRANAAEGKEEQEMLTRLLFVSGRAV